MKTDELIAVLARGPDVCPPALPVRRMVFVIVLGLLASTGLMLTLLGVRADLAAAVRLPAFWFKVAFVVALALAGRTAVARMALPGARTRWLPVWFAAPLAVIWLVAASALMHAPAGARAPLFWGSTWRVCPFLIAMLSVPVFAAILNVMRGLAPTRLRLAGAAAGFAAGAAAAVVYCLHCPEMTAPFIGFWYVLGMLIPAGVGALIGPRVLRW